MPAYILKLFDRDLVRFEARNTGDLPEITDYRIEKDALPLLPMGMEASASGLARWLRRRKIPRNRAYVHSLLARLGLGVNSTMAIINISRALSLNDSYWIVPEGFGKTFAECNLYEHGFSRVLAAIAFTGYGSRQRSSLVSSPELTTNGMLRKCWRRQNGRVFLYKGGTEGASNTGNEPYSEFYAWQIAQVLGVHAIPYTLTRWKGTLCSRCELFTSKDISFVPVGQVVKSGGMQAVLDYYGTIGQNFRDALEDMIVFDAIILNTDRHLGNFGFLVDAKSNTLLGPAPLFDHGNSLCNFAAAADIESREAFLSYANAQYPACYANFLGEARTVLRERHKKALRKLFNFRFRRHPRYNLPQKRLQLLEGQIQERAAFLLSQKDAAPCELKFW